jgi:hypothetical protein
MKMNGKTMEKNVTLADARAYGCQEQHLHTVGAACARWLKEKNMGGRRSKKGGLI